MNLELSVEEQAFREEARTWLREHLPSEERPPEGAEMREFDLAWQHTLYEGGWAGINWPTEYGGRGLSDIQQMIWYEEFASADPPFTLNNSCTFVGNNHGGPTLIVKGSEDQKAEHLPRILRGEVVWCQGFSEPGAGSDLAGLSTRAVIDGDDERSGRWAGTDKIECGLHLPAQAVPESAAARCPAQGGDYARGWWPYIEAAFSAADIPVIPVEVLHHHMPVLGFRVGGLTYITDAKSITEVEKEKIRGSKVVVVNALRRKEHISHFNLEEALALIAELAPERAFLTHISHLMGPHAEVKLPPNVQVAHDGLKVEL